MLEHSLSLPVWELGVAAFGVLLCGSSSAWESAGSGTVPGSTSGFLTPEFLLIKDVIAHTALAQPPRLPCFPHSRKYFRYLGKAKMACGTTALGINGATSGIQCPLKTAALHDEIAIFVIWAEAHRVWVPLFFLAPARGRRWEPGTAAGSQARVCAGMQIRTSLQRLCRRERVLRAEFPPCAPRVTLLEINQVAQRVQKKIHCQMCI